MTELPASQSIELVPDILETDDDLRRAVRPLTVDLMSSAPDVDNARSIYELLCRVNPEFVRADWRNEPVQAIMRQAKAVGVISAGANDSYSWWLREAWERADEESRRTAPICDLVAAVVAVWRCRRSSRERTATLPLIAVDTDRPSTDHARTRFGLHDGN